MQIRTCQGVTAGSPDQIFAVHFPISEHVHELILKNDDVINEDETFSAYQILQNNVHESLKTRWAI